jgi:molecular chaperone DnaK
VNVSAKDKATGKEQQIRIQASGGLSDNDIKKMVDDAAAHAADDKKRRALAEARNQAEAMIHTAEKNVKEHGDKIGADDKTAIEAAITELKEARDSEDVAAITAKTEKLAQASMKLGEAMYKAQQDGANANQAEGASAEQPKTEGEDKVVDAEFEEVDEEKKA